MAWMNDQLYNWTNIIYKFIGGQEGPPGLHGWELMPHLEARFLLNGNSV